MSADLLHLIAYFAIVAATVIAITAWLEKGHAQVDAAMNECLDREGRS